MTYAAIKALIAQGVADALAGYEATRNSENGDDNHDSGSGRRTERAAHECTYSDFLKCQPLDFKGTEGVVGLDLGEFEKMESVIMRKLKNKRSGLENANKAAVAEFNLHIIIIMHFSTIRVNTYLEDPEERANLKEEPLEESKGASLAIYKGDKGVELKGCKRVAK
ncbi:hypothetical protein Tco_0768695 [Tanacetum coccineum]